MARPRALTKKVDETARVRCVAGMGIIREEVWTENDGRIAKYNLAFIHHQLCKVDNGRVLGYDNAHGEHERHFKGAVSAYKFSSYETLLETSLEEVRELRRK